MRIPEQQELLTTLRPHLDKLFQRAIDDEGGGNFRSYDLERKRRILRGTFDVFWEASKDKVAKQMVVHQPSDEIVRNTILQFARDYIDEKIAMLDEAERI